MIKILEKIKRNKRTNKKYQSEKMKQMWRDKFTPQTVEQFKLYENVQEHFLPDDIEVEAVSENQLKLRLIPRGVAIKVEMKQLQAINKPNPSK